jgi:hypothetical protein
MILNNLDGNASAEKWTVDALRETKEFKAMCKLRPLRNNFIEKHHLELANIVSRYSPRFCNKDYFAGIERSIQSINAATEALEAALDDLILLDSDHLETVKVAAKWIDQKRFAKDAVLMTDLFEIIQKMRVLSAAVKIGTGVSAAKKSQGRPPSPYVQAAFELIWLWERITEVRLNPLPLVQLGHFPTAKKEIKENEEREIQATQESTEFCRLAFRMINPNIKLKEVRTAINNALSGREWMDRREMSLAEERHTLTPTYYLIKRIAAGKEIVAKSHYFLLPFSVRPLND